MLRALIYGLSILHLGPGIAFALLAFGCEEPTPYLRAVCGKSALSSFALLTAGSWLILLLGLAAMHLVQRTRSSTPLAVIATGSSLGAAGAWLTGSQHWFLAIPSALAVGWLFLANPLACQPEPPSSSGSAGSNSAA
jgi:hypothetical protein